MVRKKSYTIANTVITTPVVISHYTFTGLAVPLIFPQETASSGEAPESLPSYSCAVLTNTEKSAPLRCEDKQVDITKGGVIPIIHNYAPSIGN